MTLARHLFAATLATAAAAAEANFSVVAAGCVPTGQTTTALVHFNTAGDATFAAAKVGEIILTCPVPQSIAAARSFSVTYRDTDGPGTGAQIVASLRQKDLASAAVSDVGIAKVNSNMHPSTTSYRRMQANIGAQGCGDFNFDHGSKAYYIQVNVRRTAATHGAIIASVELSNPIC